jgi:cap2 methyltransferase
MYKNGLSYNTISYKFNNNNKCSFNIDIIEKDNRIYILEQLDKHKKRLNKYKDKLDNLDSKKYNIVKYKTNIPLYIKKYIAQNNIFSKNKDLNISRGFIKLYELLEYFDIIKLYNNFYSFHICEMPGNFIRSLSYYLYIKDKKKFNNWKWYANSLNPNNKKNIEKYGKNIFNDVYKIYKNYPNNWLWGDDNTGDISKIENIIDFSKKIKKCNLITMDCGLCIKNYNEQERELLFLFLSSVTISLTVLNKNGTLILKTFLPLVESLSVSIIYLLYCVFDKLYFTKPMASSPGSSEIYIVCINYKHLINNKMKNYLFDNLKNFKVNKSLFPVHIYNNIFLEQYEKYITLLINKQIKSIQKNLYYYNNFNKFNKLNKNKIFLNFKKKYAKHWTKLFIQN